MLTVNTLKDMILELTSLNEIGCTYDFKERFGVSLASLELLGFVKVIRSKIPECGDHCEKFADCKWISIFESRKSKSKFKMTKEGLALAHLINIYSADEQQLEKLLAKEILTIKIIDTLNSFLIDNPELSIELLTTKLLDETPLTLEEIRSSIMDILDLLVSIDVLQLKEGLISKNA
ncbi:MAG: hypothetical protein FK734_21230 [Asgard group archaeon]|nr:hypothetical protein [Asgard group archaeon]